MWRGHCSALSTHEHALPGHGASDSTEASWRALTSASVLSAHRSLYCRNRRALREAPHCDLGGHVVAMCAAHASPVKGVGTGPGRGAVSQRLRLCPGPAQVCPAAHGGRKAASPSRRSLRGEQQPEHGNCSSPLGAARPGALERAALVRGCHNRWPSGTWWS